METVFTVAFSLAVVTSAINLVGNIVLRNRAWAGWFSSMLGWATAILMIYK